MIMDPSQKNIHESGLNARVAITYLIVGLMLSSLSYLLAAVGRLFYPGLNIGLIILLSFILAWESLLSYRRTQSGEPLGPNVLIYHLAEWVIILITIKGLFYLFNAPQDFIHDLAFWQTDFIIAFFTSDYLLAIGFAGLVWGLAHSYGSILMSMECNPVDLNLEKEGYFQNDREQLKRNLIKLIFGAGGIALVVSAMASLKLLGSRSLPLSPSGMTVVLLMYFLLGFLLLAQSQYQILEARWFIQAVPSSPGIFAPWIPYSLVLLLVITLFAGLLPTSYSLGLLAVLRSVLSFLITIPVYLELICIFPFISLITSLLRALGLMKTSPELIQSAPTPVLPRATAPVYSAPVAWLELLKSIVFWLVFILVILLAIRYYINQNREVIHGLKYNRISRWLTQIWQWIFTRAKVITRKTNNFIGQKLARIKGSLKPDRPIVEPFLSISSHLPPRQRILLLYLAMIAWNEHSGIHRKRTDTPYEYAAYLSSLIPDQKEMIKELTQVFIEARYTRHQLTINQSTGAQAAWEQIQEAVRQRTLL